MEDEQAIREPILAKYEKEGHPYYSSARYSNFVVFSVSVCIIRCCQIVHYVTLSLAHCKHYDIIIIRIYYVAAQPVLSSALQYNNVIVDSGLVVIRVNNPGLLNK